MKNWINGELESWFGRSRFGDNGKYLHITELTMNFSFDMEFDNIALGMEKDIESGCHYAVGFDPSKSKGLIGRFPNYSRNRVRVRKANRYLAYQEDRIMKCIFEKKYSKAVILFLALLKCSKSYQILLFHRVTKVGYGRGNMETVERVLFKSMNKIRSCDYTLLIRRFYIMKKNGKYRPIGCPDGPSRMISKAFTDFLYHLTEDKRFEGQHGYRKARGGWSACLSIIDKLKKGMSGFEFDLKSFFNTVEPFTIGKKLEKYDKTLTHIVGGMLRDVVYRFEEIKESDSELKVLGQMGGGKLIQRFGAPQGLSLSPLLCTWAIEFARMPKDMVMYADDGIAFYRRNPGSFNEFLRDLEVTGVQIALDKSGPLKNVFKFCGIEFDCINETVRYGESMRSGNSPDLEEGFKKSFSYYGRSATQGSGDINKNSLILSYRHSMSLRDRFGTIAMGLGEGKMYKENRYFFGQSSITPILDGSSFCCNEILGIVKYKRNMLAKYGKWKTERYDAVQYKAICKGSYRNYLNNGNPKGNRPDRDYFEIVKGFEGITARSSVRVTNEQVVLNK